MEAHDICGACSIGTVHWLAKIKQEMETKKFLASESDLRVKSHVSHGCPLNLSR